MMRSNLFSKGALAAVIAAPLVLVGCGGDSLTGESPSEAGSTLVRVAHLSPDAPAVVVLVNGARVVNGAQAGGKHRFEHFRIEQIIGARQGFGRR